MINTGDIVHSISGYLKLINFPDNNNWEHFR